MCLPASGSRSLSGQLGLLISKGHSFFGYFILSLYFFPLSLLMAYMVRDNSGLATS